MKFDVKIESKIEIDDEKLLRWIDKMEDELTDFFPQIEEDYIQQVMDEIGGKLPIDFDEDEVMEKAFDLVMEIQNHVFWECMKRWNLYLVKPKR